MMDDIPVPKEYLEQIANLRFPPETDARLQHLMDVNNEGNLNEQESSELEAYVRMNELLSILKGRAMIMLRRKLQ